MEDPESEYDLDRDGNPGDFQPAAEGYMEGKVKFDSWSNPINSSILT